MEGHPDFVRQLEDAVVKRRAYLDSQRLPQLKEAFHDYQIYFDGMLNLLIRKGLLREDPYKYDQKITEISVPPDDALSESDKIDEMSYRLSAFRKQLDYMNTSYQFSTAFLDLPRLKRISALINYITWKSLTDSAKGSTSKALAAYLNKIRGGSDTMAVGILKDGLIQIEKTTRHIITILSELVQFQRELYKYTLRTRILPIAPPTAAAVSSKRPDVVKAIKRIWTQLSPGQTFYPELVEEILEEDFGADAPLRKDTLLSNLAVVEERKEESAKRVVSHREILMEAIHTVSRTGPDLSEALATLEDNRRLIFERRLSFGEKVRRWLSERVGRREEDKPMDVEYLEGAALVPKTEELYFIPFMEGAKKKSSLYNSLMNRASASYQRIENAREDQLLEFLGKQIFELQLLHRRMSGINAYFQGEAPRELRPELKGIKLQLTALMNGIVKANQRKHDYVALKEEEEQMKRLGIE